MTRDDIMLIIAQAINPTGFEPSGLENGLLPHSDPASEHQRLHAANREMIRGEAVVAANRVIDALEDAGLSVSGPAGQTGTEQ